MEKRRFIESRVRDLTLSQGEVATRVGVTPGMVWQWPPAKTPVSAKRAPQLAAVLGCRPDEVSEAYQQIALASTSHGQIVGDEAFQLDVAVLEHPKLNRVGNLSIASLSAS